MSLLQKIQSELKAPKSQFNPFGKFNYRSAEDIIEALKPILAKHECSIITPQKVIEVGGRVYIETDARLLGPDLAIVASAQAQAREEESKKGMDASQISGSTGSYSKKYALNNLFAIDDNKDPDAGDPKQVEADKKFEQYELELEAAFEEGVGAQWWKDNNVQAQRDCPKDFPQLVQQKNAWKEKLNKIKPGSDKVFEGQG